MYHFEQNRGPTRDRFLSRRRLAAMLGTSVVMYAGYAIADACVINVMDSTFAFTDVTAQQTNATITSDTVELTWGEGPVELTATCGTGCTAISRNSGSFVAGPVPGFVTGDTLAIRMTSSASFGATTTAAVKVGVPESGGTWSVWSVGTVNTANAFAFTDVTDQPLSSTITSDAVAVTWSGGGTLTATCGTGCTAISRNGGSFTAGPVSGFTSGDTIAIRQTSSASVYTPTTATVTVGSTVSTTWTVTTEVGACSPANVQTFTSSGTWTKPTTCGVNTTVVCWGAGGGGGQYGAGGGGGGYATDTVATDTLGSTVSVTIGAGGAAVGNGVFGNGGNGGNSTFGSLVTALGGNGGGGNNTGLAQTGGAGGGPSGGTGGCPNGGNSTYGGGGGGGYYLCGGGGGNGGSSTYGGGGGAAYVEKGAFGTLGTGGNGGGNGGTFGSGVILPTVPGGGGGGGPGTTGSQAGAAGKCVVTTN